MRPHPLGWLLGAALVAGAWLLVGWMLCVALHVAPEARGCVEAGIALCPVAFMARADVDCAGRAAERAIQVAMVLFVGLVLVGLAA